jgi:hypothetical protein
MNRDRDVYTSLVYTLSLPAAGMLIDRPLTLALSRGRG